MDIEKEREDFEEKFPIPAHWIEFDKKRNKYFCPYCADAAASAYQSQWETWQAKAQTVPEWISVEDGLPKDGAKVLCYGRQFMCVGVFDGDDFFDPLDGQSFVKDCVTHWMQLPASPKAQEQKG